MCLFLEPVDTVLTTEAYALCHLVVLMYWLLSVETNDIQLVLKIGI